MFSGMWSQIYDMSSASGYMGEKYFQEFGPKFLACRPGLHGLQFEAWFQISDMPPTSGNMGEKYFQECGPIFMGEIFSVIWSQCLRVTNIFRNLIPKVMGETYFQEFGPIFYGRQYFQGSGQNI